MHGSINGRKVQNIRHYNNAYELTRRSWELDQWNESLIYDHDCSNKPFSAILIENDQEINGIEASPAFIDPENGDLRLSSGSPCHDAGKALYIPELKWRQTFEGTAPEIGAYENGIAIKGPFFRVTENNDLETPHERPRISQVQYSDGSAEISFSSPLDPATIPQNIAINYDDGSYDFITEFELLNDDHTLRTIRIK